MQTKILAIDAEKKLVSDPESRPLLEDTQLNMRENGNRWTEPEQCKLHLIVKDRTEPVNRNRERRVWIGVYITQR